MNPLVPIGRNSFPSPPSSLGFFAHHHAYWPYPRHYHPLHPFLSSCALCVSPSGTSSVIRPQPVRCEPIYPTLPLLDKSDSESEKKEQVTGETFMLLFSGLATIKKIGPFMYLCFTCMSACLTIGSCSCYPMTLKTRLLDRCENDLRTWTWRNRILTKSLFDGFELENILRALNLHNYSERVLGQDVPYPLFRDIILKNYMDMSCSKQILII